MLRDQRVRRLIFWRGVEEVAGHINRPLNSALYARKRIGEIDRQPRRRIAHIESYVHPSAPRARVTTSGKEISNVTQSSKVRCGMIHGVNSANIASFAGIALCEDCIALIVMELKLKRDDVASLMEATS